MAKKKAQFKKRIKFKKVYNEKGEPWKIVYGNLKPKPGNLGTLRLFQVVAEKLPYSALGKVKDHLINEKIVKTRPQGVYIAHDSMGCPRYIGRGRIFNRLSSRYKKNSNELHYFSFYVVKEKKHEREIETLLIRAASFLLEFNDKKKRVGTSPGSIKDYEAGTQFYERQWKRGKKRVSKRRRRRR